MITSQAVAQDIESVVNSLSENEAEFSSSSDAEFSDHLDRVLPKSVKKFCMRQAAERLSPALLHVVQQPTIKRRDRALAALIALIYGPTPFGGANTLKEVAIRYSMTEQNLYALMNTQRALLAPSQATQPHDFERVG